MRSDVCTSVYVVCIRGSPWYESMFSVCAQVDTVHRAFEARREYIAMWLSAHEKAVLEYDTEGFTFVSFLFEIKGFYALVHCEWRETWQHLRSVAGCLLLLQGIFIHTYVRT